MLDMAQTATQQLLAVKLGADLGEYVRIRRARGMGWRKIAADLHKDSGHAVSFETLRSWFPEDRAA